MDEYDLLIIADATASMSNYLHALNISLPQTISISALTGCFSRIGLLAYRDYNDETPLEWSGWLQQNSDDDPAKQQPDLVAMAKQLEPYGGGDYAEATKTALAKAYEVMRSDAKTLVFLYTDAPPHANDADVSLSDNPLKERTALSETDSYSGFGSAFTDWVAASNALRAGEKQAQVFAILEPDMPRNCAAYYNFLCTRTGGACVYLRDSSPGSISKVTVDLLLAWMGLEKAPVAGSKKGNKLALPADLSRYISVKGIKQIKDEDTGQVGLFFASPGFKNAPYMQNIATIKLTAEIMKRYLPKKNTPVEEFSKRWNEDEDYKEIAVKHLMKIIHDDIRAIALNPVFGTLWRAVCNDRNYFRRDEIVLAFTQSLNRMGHAGEKAKMKAWLEESYDFTEEIQSIIDNIPAMERFPCVFLDPTLDFSSSNNDSRNKEDDEKPMFDLTRAELLEIGRFCNADILRRLSRILTRLTVVNSADEMPEHIQHASAKPVPRIPLALALEKHNRQFWKILFHVIVPGTRLSARPAALVAALSLRLGIAPFTDAAEGEMLAFKDKWNDASTPENWTIGCLTLLIDADEAYQKQQQYSASGETTVVEKLKVLVNSGDRVLFERLVAFKMLELNLDTPLKARVSWTPNKAVASIGPLATCRSCQYPRSVTIMGDSGKCGACLATDYVNAAQKENRIQTRVSQNTTTASEATWVECGVHSCRAQYVVYAADALNVRAKCYYCRRQSKLKDTKQTPVPAPVVECKRCLNRMIWPRPYRPSRFNESDFICPPCTSGCDPATEIELTARKIAAENTLAWLVRDTQNTDAKPFQNRSLFQTISAMGVDGFLSRIGLFPSEKATLSHSGKPIHNAASLITTLQDIVHDRKTSQVDCSLCFSAFRAGTLNPACGRRGCFQQICNTCLASWYGLNAAGSIINTAALACPFCRRLPTPRTLAKYGMGIHAVCNLADAVRDQGTLIYAWCGDCCTAKEYMERSCARGAPPEIRHWTCTECVEEVERQRLEHERQLAEQALADARAAQDLRRQEEAERRRRIADESAAAWRISRLKPCPGCGTLTEKISGCGHVVCTVRRCKTHWCYFCGNPFSKDRIYEHMDRDHRGLFTDEYGVENDTL
ncbi:hypothetical protein NUU61_000771 [Penicillium alfredii]|uniref:RBR-type E3 ubiquitin transferase n=1 Tax=Penicillium alfredii TaxID=1506179 RepID=A0A9W9GBD6_9EURO|nr:uncharacterized protein NUU61_000771 [Penicillium alfredii]KAJ5115012.1 hypothetical protein NUU61_000771 [Penicillium alfredii]